MRRLSAGAVLALLAPPHAAAYNEYCEDPGFVLRAPAPLPPDDLTKLLTSREKIEPGGFERAFLEPGPYGHGELGFRYLARAFGYPGKDLSRRAVESWLAERELKDPEFKGTWELWVKWVREPKVLLRSRQKPVDSSLGSYFRDPLDAAAYGACVAGELARKRCENFLGKELLPKTRVYFAQTQTSRQPCRVHYIGGTLEQETPDQYEVPVRQYYKINNRGEDRSIVKVEGGKKFTPHDDFTGKDDKPGGNTGALPAR